MTDNERIARSCLAQFDPAAGVSLTPTNAINGRAVADCWVLAYFAKDQQTGMTMIIKDRKVHAYIETKLDGLKFGDAVARYYADMLGIPAAPPVAVSQPE